MGLVFSRSKLIKKLLGFIIVGLIGWRPDVALKVVVYLQAESFKVINADWGCPAVFNPNSCKEYDANFYK